MHFTDLSAILFALAINYITLDKFGKFIHMQTQFKIFKTFVIPVWVKIVRISINKITNVIYNIYCNCSNINCTWNYASYKTLMFWNIHSHIKPWFSLLQVNTSTKFFVCVLNCCIIHSCFCISACIRNKDERNSVENGYLIFLLI